MPRQGLIIVNTGDGKGKTTAALGLALRAIGQGMSVCFIQFLKGRWPTGEAKIIERLSDAMEIHTLGRGFTWESENLEEDTRIARDAWAFAKDIILAGRHDVIVLDELTHLINLEMIEEHDVLDVLAKRTDGMHIVITGRGAREGLIAASDLVTDMQMVKHPFDTGVKAQRGIEF